MSLATRALAPPFARELNRGCGFLPSPLAAQDAIRSRRSSTTSWHRGCSPATMIDVALSVLALLAGGLSLELYAASRSPLGCQDELGLHLGAEAQKCAEAGPSEKSA
jgi:hypothetical protein